MTGTRATAGLPLFTDTAEAAASEVIRAYSTSFGLATRLLGRRHRQHVRNIYAMVRIADELVDGVTEEAGLDAAAQLAALCEYEQAVGRAIRLGCSGDMVLHAFARTARDCGIDEDLTAPFFDSMRMDLRPAGATTVRGHDDRSHEQYVHGSAEVVGLMCLRVFLCHQSRSDGQLSVLEHGARALGAAFQDVNFLRDLADDTERLHRSYLREKGRLTDADRDARLLRIRARLAEARVAVPLLPRDARVAVRSALGLFAALADRISATPVSTLYSTRVRVPDARKAAIVAGAVLRTVAEPGR
ncbi:phytoene/squalene synthase family protein [Microbacterium soli]|uniref:Squalene/phytoene synthase family protein n=1 Tax=Microbacterium soli TaxID=446075 RepID=A0ABP7NH73_9MICO